MDAQIFLAEERMMAVISFFLSIPNYGNMQRGGVSKILKSMILANELVKTVNLNYGTASRRWDHARSLDFS